MHHAGERIPAKAQICMPHQTRLLVSHSLEVRLHFKLDALHESLNGTGGDVCRLLWREPAAEHGVVRKQGAVCT